MTMNTLEAGKNIDLDSALEALPQIVLEPYIYNNEWEFTPVIDTSTLAILCTIHGLNHDHIRQLTITFTNEVDTKRFLPLGRFYGRQKRIKIMTGHIINKVTNTPAYHDIMSNPLTQGMEVRFIGYAWRFLPIAFSCMNLVIT